MPDSISIAGDNLTVDLVLYRRDGRAGQALVEEAFGLNPGLAALGPILPVSTIVILPDRPPAPPQALREPVSLFD